MNGSSKSDFVLDSNEATENYFLNNSKALLVTSVKILLNPSNSNNSLNYLIDDFKNSQASIKMLKIISSLIEKQEIGQHIIEDILLGMWTWIFHYIS